MICPPTIVFPSRPGGAGVYSRPPLKARGSGEFAVYRPKLGADVTVAGHNGKLRTERLTLLGRADSGTQTMDEVFEEAKLVRCRKLSNESLEFDDCSGRHVTP